jgi:hypothetical protein
MAIQVRLSRVLCLVDSAPFLHGFKASADRARQHSTAAAVSPKSRRPSGNKQTDNRARTGKQTNTQTNKHPNKHTNKQKWPGRSGVALAALRPHSSGIGSSRRGWYAPACNAPPRVATCGAGHLWWTGTRLVPAAVRWRTEP